VPPLVSMHFYYNITTNIYKTLRTVREKYLLTKYGIFIC